MSNIQWQRITSLILAIVMLTSVTSSQTVTLPSQDGSKLNFDSLDNTIKSLDFLSNAKISPDVPSASAAKSSVNSNSKTVTPLASGTSLKLDQCANGGVTSPVDCIAPGSNTGWGSGNANANNAHLVEGQSQSYRLIGASVPAGSGTIVYEFDYTKGGKLAQDFPTRYNNMGTTVIDPTGGTTFSGAPTSSMDFPALTTSIIPAGPYATQSIAAQSSFYTAHPTLKSLSMWGGTITGISYSPKTPFDPTGDSSIDVTITYTKATAGDLLVSMGGHISLSSDYTGGLTTAVTINGSPYHHRAVSASFTNVGNQDMQLASGAVAVVTTGTITVIKKIINDNGGTLTISGVTLKIDGNTVTNGTSNTLGAGSHTVSETAISGYTATFSGDCNSSGVVSLVAGQNAVCTITNNDNSATITVIKKIINDNGGTATLSSFTPLKVDATTVTNGTATGFSPGSHTVTETNAAGYTATFSGDCNSSGVVSLTTGQNAVCTITNNDNAGTITVIKKIINDNGGTLTIAGVTLKVDATTVTNGTANPFNAGAHTVSETAIPGYTSTITGDCAANGSITLALG
ncbi:MAG: hypothetical protein ACREAD_04185, partial [Nitrosopumilaceae archaeon]